MTKRFKLFPYLSALLLFLTFSVACKKDCSSKLTFYEVGMTGDYKNWRDTSFIVATKDENLIKEINAQLKLPVEERRMVIGKLEAGSAGYNRNATHEFKWHFKENDWHLTDMTVEIYDGRPHSDVDADTTYWLNTMTRFAPWSSYIKRKLK